MRQFCQEKVAFTDTLCIGRRELGKSVMWIGMQPKEEKKRK